MKRTNVRKNEAKVRTARRTGKSLLFKPKCRDLAIPSLLAFHKHCGVFVLVRASQEPKCQSAHQGPELAHTKQDPTHASHDANTRTDAQLLATTRNPALYFRFLNSKHTNKKKLQDKNRDLSVRCGCRPCSLVPASAVSRVCGVKFSIFFPIFLIYSTTRSKTRSTTTLRSA